ncbi:MAG: DUF5752 family protein, partial [Petrotogales bacterium]
MDTVPKEKAFYFFTSIGNYTGKKAHSLKEFIEILQEIEYKSVEFHLYRGDFQKWFREVININELADQIDKVKNQKMKGELLRVKILNCISEYLEKQSAVDKPDKKEANLLVTFDNICYPEAREEIKQILGEIGEAKPQFIHSKVQGLFKLCTNMDPKEATKKLDALCRDKPSKFRFM